MSGTSTPLGNRSPPPPDGGGQQAAAGNGPAPSSNIGTRFVKHYYQTLMKAPDQLHKFYQPTSFLSDGEGSSPTDPGAFESAYGGSAEKLKDRFYVNDLQLQLDFEHGGIDTQQSVNGCVLLVVTGHAVYYPSASEQEDAVVDDPIRKGFVHTFFLKPMTIGTKKNFYVHNDILRFLKNISEVSVTASESAAVVTETEAVAETPKEPTPPAQAVPETKSSAPTTQKPPLSAPVETKAVEKPKVSEKSPNEAPGGGVEETKEEPAAATAPTPAAKASKEDKPSKKDSKGSAKKEEAAEKDSVAKAGKSNSRNKPAKDTSADAGRKSPVPPPSPAPKPPPGSWASLVAGAGGNAAATTTSSAVKAPSPASAKAPSKPTPAPEKPATQPANDKKKDSGGGGNSNTGNNANSNSSSNNHKMGNNNNNMRPPKRDPDCTLVIKNLADNTKEADVLGLFEPFAAQTKTRVVGITVAAHRGIAFVDYDSINPVMKAVGQHKEEPMRLFGRVLEVDQKTAEQRARRAANRGGGGPGSGGGGNHNGGGVNRYGSGRGHRRRDGRGGGRGGR